MTFLQFIRQRDELVNLAALTAVLAAVGIAMHVYYPFPFFFPDSGAYILSAATSEFDIYRPMGYSVYLRFLHDLQPTIGFVYVATYVLYALSSLLLLFTARYTLAIRNRWLFGAMSLCVLLSPRLIFSCNFIMSDALFAILAALFTTALLWMLHGRSWLWTVVSLASIWWMCSVRYSGLFFIPIAAVAMFISFGRWRKPLAWGMAMVPLLLGGLFYKTTRDQYREATHVDTFSGFGGWQSLNNALVLYPEAKQLPAKAFDGKDVRHLHQFLQQMPDSLFDAAHSFNTGYMWNRSLPPKRYTFYMCQTTGTSYTRQWPRSGELFGRYASQLIVKRGGGIIT